MPLTEKQKNDLRKLETDTWLEILDLGKEVLGIVSQRQYKEVMGWKFSREYLNQCLSSGKIRSFQIDKQRFPIINDE